MVGRDVFRRYRPSMKESKVNLVLEYSFLWWGKELNHRKRTNGKMLINLTNPSHVSSKCHQNYHPKSLLENVVSDLVSNCLKF